MSGVTFIGRLALAVLLIVTPVQAAAPGTPGAGGWDGDVVFAGFGITAPDVGWDDYAGLDVRGRMVLVVEGEPRRADPGGPFRRPDAYHYAERSHKVINAREHGAAGVLLVAHPERAGDALPAL